MIKIIDKIATVVSKNLVIFLIGCMSISMLEPRAFLWAGPHVLKLIMIIMFCMGITLDFSQFVAVAKNPKATILGLALQFTASPLLALFLGKIFKLPDELIIGFVLMGAAPTGVASNVMTFIAKGDVALNISMVSIATLLASVATPFLTKTLVGQYTDVNFIEMFLSVLKTVVAPVLLGIIVHKIIGDLLEKIRKILVLVSSISIVIAVAAIVASSRDRLLTSGLIIICVVLIHNLLGYLYGYYFGRLIGLSKKQCITLCFQTGLKNTGLVAGLANANFTPGTAVPAAVGSAVHQITSPILASWFANKEE